MNRSLLVLLVLGGAAAAGWYVAGGSLSGAAPTSATKPEPAAGAAKPALPTVSVINVAPADFVETVLVTGSIVARDEVMIAPEIEGFRIVELTAEEGDTVTKGQPLARLASDTLEAQLAQSDANLARASAAISVARSAILQAEAAQKEATAAFDRARPLKQTGAITEALFDQREAASKTAAARLTSAKDSLRSAEAEKTALEANRRELAWRASRAEIRSPVDGMISRRTARVGMVASAGADALFRIIARGEVELDTEVAERDIGRIREGQPAAISVTGGIEAKGTVRLVSREVDRTTRIGRARVTLGTDPALKLGAFGRGTIEVARGRGLAVPTSAVVFTADGTTVQVVKGDRVETRPVVTGLRSPQMIEIRQGLADGDIVVARSGSFLRDGDRVRPVKAATNLSSVGATETAGSTGSAGSAGVAEGVAR
jgi:RND family efflux transporter MFP subunit